MALAGKKTQGYGREDDGKAQGCVEKQQAPSGVKIAIYSSRGPK
jgi:hypothetical protein